MPRNKSYQGIIVVHIRVVERAADVFSAYFNRHNFLRGSVQFPETSAARTKLAPARCPILTIAIGCIRKERRLWRRCMALDDVCLDFWIPHRSDEGSLGDCFITARPQSITYVTDIRKSDRRYGERKARRRLWKKCAICCLVCSSVGNTVTSPNVS